MTPQNIEVVNLTRGVVQDSGGAALWVEGGGHRVWGPYDAAECEVKARVLRSLAARARPPDGVAFMREWETPEIPHLDKLATTRCGSFDGRGSQCERANGHTGACVSQNVNPSPASADVLAPHGVTQSGSFGPAAEMAAAARDAQAKPRGRRGR